MHSAQVRSAVPDTHQRWRETVLFASVRRDLDAVKARFGDDWRVSYLPEGVCSAGRDLFRPARGSERRLARGRSWRLAGTVALVARSGAARSALSQRPLEPS